MRLTVTIGRFCMLIPLALLHGCDQFQGIAADVNKSATSTATAVVSASGINDARDKAIAICTSGVSQTYPTAVLDWHSGTDFTGYSVVGLNKYQVFFHVPGVMESTGRPGSIAEKHGGREVGGRSVVCHTDNGTITGYN